MKFFIPLEEDEKKAEEIYEAIKSFAHTTMGWQIHETRIYSIYFSHDGKQYTATVGESAPEIGELVVAILASSGAYLVCTPNRGVIRGMPYLAGKVHSVTEFDK